jgi:hypothetical protein
MTFPGHHDDELSARPFLRFSFFGLLVLKVLGDAERFSCAKVPVRGGQRNWLREDRLLPELSESAG